MANTNKKSTAKKATAKKAAPKKATAKKTPAKKAAAKKAPAKKKAASKQSEIDAVEQFIEKHEAAHQDMIQIDFLRDEVVEWAKDEAEELVSSVPDEIKIDLTATKSWIRRLFSRRKK
jgi:hypothetical protein